MLGDKDKAQAKTTTPAFVWGYNNRAGLGTASVARTPRPVPVDLPAGTVDVQGGADFTVALTATGEVWSWGGNDHGQLARGTASRLDFSPQRVDLPAVASISVGQGHVLAATTKGHLYAWGRNKHGQVGDGTNVDQAAPVEVAEIGRRARVATGNHCSLIIDTDGTVSMWGQQIPGGAAGGKASDDAAKACTLGKGAKAGLLKAELIDAGVKHTVVLSTGGELRGYGLDVFGRPVPEQLHLEPSWGQITAISARDYHTVALTDRGTVLTWGSNYYGQLGLGTRKTQPHPTPVYRNAGSGRVVEVVAAGEFTLVRTDDHRVYAWGRGTFGQIGTGTLTDTQTRPELVALPDNTEICSIHAGHGHVLAIVHTCH